MENLKHIKDIEEELKTYGLTLEDLTNEELKERDAEIECVKNGGLLLDGVSATYPSKAYAKMERQKDNRIKSLYYK